MPLVNMLECLLTLIDCRLLFSVISSWTVESRVTYCICFSKNGWGSCTITWQYHYFLAFFAFRLLSVVEFLSSSSVMGPPLLLHHLHRGHLLASRSSCLWSVFMAMIARHCCSLYPFTSFSARWFLRCLAYVFCFVIYHLHLSESQLERNVSDSTATVTNEWLQSSLVGEGRCGSPTWTDLVDEGRYFVCVWQIQPSI